jgi:hypothetical protein
MRTESLGLRLVLICPSSGVVLYPRVSRKNGGTVVLNSIASGLPSNPVIALVSTRIWGFRLPQKHEGNGRYLKIPFSAFGCRIWTSTSSLFTTNCRTQICSSSVSKKKQSTFLSNNHSRRKSVPLKLAFPAFSLRRFMTCASPFHSSNRRRRFHSSGISPRTTCLERGRGNTRRKL